MNTDDVVGQTTVECILDMVESAALVDLELAQLETALRFEDNVNNIAASIAANGIDAGTEALFGASMSKYFEKWDAEDSAGTLEAIAAGMESISTRVVGIVRNIIERIRTFIQKLTVNEEIIRAGYMDHKQRVEDHKFWNWKNPDKKIDIVKAPVKDAVRSIATATSVFKQLKSGEFKLTDSDLPSGIVADDITKGTLVAKLRKLLKETNTYNCSDYKGDEIEVLVSDVIGWADEYIETIELMKANESTLKSITLKRISEKTGNEVSISRAASAASAIFTINGIASLKGLRGCKAILKNIK